jgi:hypothetical protein
MNKIAIVLCTLVSINAIACGAAPKAEVRAATAAQATEKPEFEAHLPPPTPSLMEANRLFSCRWAVVQTGRVYDSKEDARREGLKAAKERGLRRIDVAERCRSEETPVSRTASR